MRKATLLLFVIAALTAPLLLAGPMGCFEPDLPNVAFSCGEDDACPDGYECRTDGCCHKIGSPLDEHGPCTDPDVDAAVSQDASA